jgi:hypothetical protein
MSGPASLTVGERRQSFSRFLRSSDGEISAPDLAWRAVTLAVGKQASRNVDQVFCRNLVLVRQRNKSTAETKPDAQLKATFSP